MKGSIRHHITRRTREGAEEVEDLLAVESRLSISVNGTEILSLYCTPLMIRELVVGLIMTEGIAQGLCAERMSILYSEEGVRVEAQAEGEVRTGGGEVTSGCVGGLTYRKELSEAAKDDPFSISAGRLTDLFQRFQKRSGLFKDTGCVHSAAISDGREIQVFAEDIGRHNAVDKCIGYTILEGAGFSGRLMLASGRLSSEIVSKCARWGLPMIVSRSAPTDLAVRIAERSGITLAGFLRGRRFNLYCHPHRVTG